MNILKIEGFNAPTKSGVLLNRDGANHYYSCKLGFYKQIDPLYEIENKLQLLLVNDVNANFTQISVGRMDLFV